MITKFIPLIQLILYSKTTLTKKDPLTVNKRFLPSDKMVTIAQKFGPQPQTLGVISGSRKLLIPHMNSVTPYGLYQPRTTTVLSAPLLYNHRSSMNNKIISNPNIKFTSLLENKKIDLLLEEAKTAIDFQKYIEILDDIKVKNFTKTKISDENLLSILTELKKNELSLERRQEVLYNLQIYFKNNSTTIEFSAIFIDLWFKNDCVFTALEFNLQIQSIAQVRAGKNKNKSKDPNKNKRLEEEQEIIISQMLTMCKKIEEDMIKFEQESTKILSCNLIQNWYNYLINRSNALPLQPEEFEINNKLLLLGKTFASMKENALEQTININNSKNKESLEDKQEKTESKVLVMSILMNKLFLDFKNNPKKIIESPLLQIWCDYLIKRGSDLILQPEELEINKELDLLWKTFAPSQPDVLNKIKDNLISIKENSKLTEPLKQNIKECFTSEDYIKEIIHIKDILEVLENNINLSDDDIKLLTIISSAAIIDDEGTFKLTQEAYKNFNENKNTLGFSYMQDKPNMNYILNQIKDKNYFIINEYKNKPGSLIDIAYLGHKTLVIFDENSGKNLKVRIGLLTSTKDENTFLLDNYQQTNPDVVNQKKKQYFRILSNFIIVEENEPLFVDMETTLLLHNKNSNNIDITEILQINYEKNKNIWSNNNYQLSYNANGDFLKTIAIIFFKKKLQILEDNLHMLEEKLEKLEENDRVLLMDTLAKEKHKQIEDKKFQQYISLLPEQYQELHKVLKLFEIKQQQEASHKKQQETKQKMNKIAKDLKKAQEQEQQKQEDKTLTAKERKKLYLANKNKDLHEKNL